MKKNIPKFPVSVHLVIIKNNKVLLMKRQNTGFCDNMYCLPAGKLENNESVSVGMIREAKEELDIDIEKFEVNHVMNRKGNDFNRIDYFFIIKKYRGSIKNNEPNKCIDLIWADINSLPDDTIGYIEYAINCIQKNIKFSEYGW